MGAVDGLRPELQAGCSGVLCAEGDGDQAVKSNTCFSVRSSRIRDERLTKTSPAGSPAYLILCASASFLDPHCGDDCICMCQSALNCTDCVLLFSVLGQCGVFHL